MFFTLKILSKFELKLIIGSTSLTSIILVHDQSNNVEASRKKIHKGCIVVVNFELLKIHAKNVEFKSLWVTIKI